MLTSYLVTKSFVTHQVDIMINGIPETKTKVNNVTTQYYNSIYSCDTFRFTYKTDN